MKIGDIVIAPDTKESGIVCRGNNGQVYVKYASGISSGSFKLTGNSWLENYLKVVKIKRNKIMFKIGDKIIMMRRPDRWSSDLGEYPMDLEYPRQFIIKNIKDMDNYITVGTEDGYGLVFSKLKEDNNIELISSDEKLNKRRTIKMKLNSMMKRLLDADVKKLVEADLIDGDLELTDKCKENLMAILFEEKKAELVKIAEEEIKEKTE